MLAATFVPLLNSVTSVASRGRSEVLYIRLLRADDFIITHNCAGSAPSENDLVVAALVDVFSDSAHQHLVYPNLTVVTVATDLLSSRSQPNWRTFLLEFFSVNLKKEAIASGHTRPNSLSGQGALEFIAFGVPQQKAVSNWSRRR
jgi:hypothetical protein